MKQKVFGILFALMLVSILVMSTPVTAAKGGNSNGAYRGEDTDEKCPELGMIKYLGTPAGYHFWFTPIDDIGPYLADRSYHNVYQLAVGDPSEWAGPTTIPDRKPYNLVGHDPGTQAYYKIFDTTTDTQVRP